MRKITFAVIATVLICGSFFVNGCGKSGPKEQNPFTLEYKIDKAGMQFFTDGESRGTIMMSSPFYAGTHPIPGQKTYEYDEARTKKVQEIISGADQLVTTAQKIKPTVTKLRVAYLEYLDTCIKKDKSLKKFGKESAADMLRLPCRETVAEAAYLGLQIPDDNEIAKTSMQYLKVIKAMELAAFYVEDVSCIVGQAAMLQKHCENSSDSAIKAAGAKLDAGMSQVDSISKDIESLSQGLTDVRFAIKQLKTGDYYLALSALQFMNNQLPQVKAKLATLKPGKEINAADIELFKSYSAYFEKFSANAAKSMSRVQPKDLVEVSIRENTLLPCAYARGDEDVYNRAVQSQEGRPKTSNEGPGFLSLVWQTTKRLPGMVVETADMTAKVAMRTTMGAYYGSSWEDTKKDIKAMSDDSQDRMMNNQLGTPALRDAKQMMEDMEKSADETVSGAIRNRYDDPLDKQDKWAPWIAGKMAKATVGIFTGFAKGTYALADPSSTTGEQAVGVMEIGFSLFGGSKVVLPSSMTPGLLKGMGEGGLLGGKRVLNWLMTPSLPDKIKPFAYTLEIFAKQRAAQALAASNQAIKNQLQKLIKAGFETWSLEAKQAAKESLTDMLKTEFKNNLSGVAEAMATLVGKSPSAIMDSIMGQIGDDAFKSMVQEAIDGPAYNGVYRGYISGGATGSIRYTVAGKSVSGSVSGAYKGDRFTGSFSGSINTMTGEFSTTLRGRAGDSEFGSNFVGGVKGSISGNGSSGSWWAKNQYGSPEGEWSAKR